MIPNDFLCKNHQVNLPEATGGLLWHQIDQIRREDCRCDIHMIQLWYDLIGFQYDITDENSEKR